MQSLQSLQTLHVCSARLDLDGACKLAVAFPQLVALTALDLSDNNLAWFGRCTADVGSERTAAFAKALAVLPALQVCTWHARCFAAFVLLCCLTRLQWNLGLLAVHALFTNMCNATSFCVCVCAALSLWARCSKQCPCSHSVHAHGLQWTMRQA